MFLSQSTPQSTLLSRLLQVFRPRPPVLCRRSCRLLTWLRLLPALPRARLVQFHRRLQASPRARPLTLQRPLLPAVLTRAILMRLPLRHPGLAQAQHPMPLALARSPLMRRRPLAPVLALLTRLHHSDSPTAQARLLTVARLLLPAALLTRRLPPPSSAQAQACTVPHLLHPPALALVHLTRLHH